MSYVGLNIGFEQNGDKAQSYLRPVLVYKKFSKKISEFVFRYLW